ncbi:hypothetical protein [Pseudoalteromonas sp. TB64]|uniref:hypothetical protein n=1 Tax=Pseudoalteromonas sp. TB64 TaxID=1938600 RepID=UPI000405B924|nr:hypothetical protein [Pseudoalteromonas sp. TB64]
MKKILLLIALTPFISKAEIYKCETKGIVSFTDKPCKSKSEKIELNNNKSKSIKCGMKKPCTTIKTKSSLSYLRFKWGSTACPDVNDWKLAITKMNNKQSNAFKHTNSKCLYLRENTYVYGILETINFNGSELIKVKASNGINYWLERAGVMPVVEKTKFRPKNWSTDLRTLLK